MTLTTHPRDHRLMINSIKYSGDLTEGGQVTAVANITNGSDNYDLTGRVLDITVTLKNSDDKITYKGDWWRGIHHPAAGAARRPAWQGLCRTFG